MDERKTPLELGRRERQLVETVTKLGEASVSDVLENLANPPSYSSVRAMLGLLVEKKWLKFRKVGKRYLYRPAASRRKSQKNAVSRMLSTFFADSPTDAFAALLDSSANNLTDADLARLQEMIEQARKEKE